MRWVTGYRATGGSLRVGLLSEESVYWADEGQTLLSLLQGEVPLKEVAIRLTENPSTVDLRSECQLHSPLPNPPSIRDYASFEQHIHVTYAAIGRQIGDRWKDEPSSFFLNPINITGPEATIYMPAECEQLDFEVEIAVVIGREARDLSPNEARDYIAGFTILNDWSCRDVQRRESERGLNASKSKDFTTTIGPWLVTPEEFDETTAEARVSVNGRQYGRGRLADIWWSLNELVAYSSMDCTLRPGEIIASGTLPNCCILELSSTNGVEKYPWLVTGDCVEIEIDGLGVLRNTVSKSGRKMSQKWKDKNRIRPRWSV